MSTKTSDRRAIGDALNAIAGDLQTYAPFVIGRVTIHLDAGHFEMEVVDRLGYVDAENELGVNDSAPKWSDFAYSAYGETFDDAVVALAHELAGTEEAPF